MHRFRIVWGLFAAGSLACGSTGSNGTPKGSAGADSNGGSAGRAGASAGGSANASSGSSSGGTGPAGGSNAAGTAGGSPVGDTPAEACIAYARAACERQVSCQGLQLSICANVGSDCPDTYFSPGSTRTVAGLKACAIERANQPCAEVLAGKLPDCVTPGTRQVGESCIHSSQCGSSACSATGDACGACLAVVGAGEDCAPTGPDCESGLACVTGKCVARPLRPPTEPGQPCTEATQCRDGFCSEGKCQPLGAVAARCLNTSECQPGLVCDRKGFDCRPPGKLGEPCIEEAGTSERLCADSTCYVEVLPSAGTCGPHPQLGESCLLAIGTEAFLALDCAPGAHCGAGSLCAVDLELGAPTESGLDCKEGLELVCPANSPDRFTCDKHICGKPGFAGDPCAPDGNPCHPAFACEANKCVPRTNRGLFEQTCQP